MNLLLAIFAGVSAAAAVWSCVVSRRAAAAGERSAAASDRSAEASEVSSKTAADALAEQKRQYALGVRPNLSVILEDRQGGGAHSHIIVYNAGPGEALSVALSLRARRASGDAEVVDVSGRSIAPDGEWDVKRKSASNGYSQVWGSVSCHDNSGSAHEFRCSEGEMVWRRAQGPG